MASAATVSVPFDLIEAGTSFATAALAPPPEDDAAGVDVDADVELELELALLLLLLLLPQAVTATTHESTSATSSGFLQITIRLLQV